ncbi:MAG: ribonuclease [Deltaproteobacteria bacterium]|nr:ribonuclease [Deltaproteobacteria bacterium]
MFKNIKFNRLVLMLFFIITVLYINCSAVVNANCLVKERWLIKNYDYKVKYYEINNIPTDFFLLVYSNSDNFCRYQKRRGNIFDYYFQCLSPNEFGWVIHGLWGESEWAYVTGRNKHPRCCKGDLEPVPIRVMKPYLCMSPGTKLLQGEWEKHGACDFDTAEDYFEKTLELYERFETPPVEISAKQAVRWMKKNNPKLKYKRLYLTRHEFGICFDTNFNLISCPYKNN